MKNLFKIMILFLVTVGFSQDNTSKGKNALNIIKISSVDVSVTVDSIEDLEATFDLRDIKELIELSELDEPLSFEIVCKNEDKSNEKKTTLSYRVTGNTNDSKGFLKSVKKVRKAAIEYYKNKE